MTTQNFYGPVEQVAGNSIINLPGGRGRGSRGSVDRANELYQRGKWHEAQRNAMQREADGCRPTALYLPLGFLGLGLALQYLPNSIMGYGLLALVFAVAADVRRMGRINARRAKLESQCRTHNEAIASINDEIARL